MLVDYTSPTSVRALLGVTAKELSDETLADSFFWLSLQAELRRVCTTIEADFMAANEDSETDADASLFAGAVSLFAAYALARTCMVAMPQFAVRSLTDGKAGFIRHTSTSFDNSMSRFDIEYGRAKASLVAAYASYLPDAVLAASTTRSLFSTSEPSYDPVVGGE